MCGEYTPRPSGASIKRSGRGGSHLSGGAPATEPDPPARRACSVMNRWHPVPPGARAFRPRHSLRDPLTTAPPGRGEVISRNRAHPDAKDLLKCSRTLCRDEPLKRTSRTRFFQEVDKGLHKLLKSEPSPLVLAGLEHILSIYREGNLFLASLPHERSCTVELCMLPSDRRSQMAAPRQRFFDGSDSGRVRRPRVTA